MFDWTIKPKYTNENWLTVLGEERQDDYHKLEDMADIVYALEGGQLDLVPENIVENFINSGEDVQDMIIEYGECLTESDAQCAAYEYNGVVFQFQATNWKRFCAENCTVHRYLPLMVVLDDTPYDTIIITEKYEFIANIQEFAGYDRSEFKYLIQWDDLKKIFNQVKDGDIFAKFFESFYKATGPFYIDEVTVEHTELILDSLLDMVSLTGASAENGILYTFKEGFNHCLNCNDEYVEIDCLPLNFAIDKNGLPVMYDVME